MRIVSLAGLVLGLVLGLGACAGSGDDGADSANADLSAAPTPGLLALGDSIAYGWRPDWSQSQPGQPDNPANLQKAILGQGYPEKAAKTLGLPVANGSCPGEASGSFNDATALDNGCRQKRIDGLKMTTPWGTAKTQLEFAIDEIKGPNPPKVITIDLGGNDLFLLQDSCKNFLLGSTACIAAAATLGTHGDPVGKYGQNLEATFVAMFKAGYRGTVVMVTTYAMEYGSFGEPLVFGQFNDALRDAVRRASAQTPGMKILIGDAYSKFKDKASSDPSFGKSACKAGLLINVHNGQPIVDDDGNPTCDRHPSQAGHELIAESVLDALK
jgi:lysophospholipase L1-like esterase